MTQAAWREDDFEESGLDAHIIVSSGSANTSIIETEPCGAFVSQRLGDIFYMGQDGTVILVEAKSNPERKDKNVRRWLQSWNPHPETRDKLISLKWQLFPSIPQTGVVLSSPLINEAFELEATANVSAYATFWEYNERENVASIHPVTKSIYKQLVGIPKSYKQPMKAILNELVASLPKTQTNKLPPLRLAALEDGSYLLEWIFKDRRLGFSFEADPRDSGWYYVYSGESSERYESGSMDQLEMSRLTSMALKP